MPIPDISTLTLDELRDLIGDANSRYATLEHTQQQETADLRTQIDAAIAQLDALLGPEGAPPGTDSIRAVLAYSDAEMAANAGVAFRLTFAGLAEVTRITRDIASVVSRDTH